MGGKSTDPMMTAAHYDALAPYYKLVYRDWEASVQQQAAALHGVIREFFGPTARCILDAACGIGTQALGLARIGYEVTASDFSPAAVARARVEAASRGLSINLCVADMRGLWEAHGRAFDVVLACDNAVPHLLSDADLLVAFRQFHRCTRPAGGCIISVRDYAEMDREGPKLVPRWSHNVEGGRIVLFDVWDFDGDFYDITTYVLEDRGGDAAQTRIVRGGRYYCVTVPTLESLLVEAGFKKATVLRDRFFQPLIVGTR